MKFQERHFCGSRDTDVKFFLFQVMCPSLLTICNQTWMLHRPCMVSVGMTFQENPMNGSRDRDEKLHCFASKVPFIIDWSEQNSRAVQGMRANREGKCCRKIPPVEAETQSYSFFDLQARCSSLFTVRKQTYSVSSTCVKNVMYNVAGYSLLWKLRTRQKRCFVLQEKWSSVLTDRNQTYVVSSACVKNSRFEDLRKTLERKPRNT